MQPHLVKASGNDVLGWLNACDFLVGRSLLAVLAVIGEKAT